MSEEDVPHIDDSHPLTKPKLTNILIALYEWGIDDVLIQDDEFLAVKRKNRLITVGSRPLELETVQQVLDTMHRPTSSATIQEGTDFDFTYSVQKDRVTAYRFRVNATGALGMYGNPIGLDITMRRIAQVPPTLDALNVPAALADNLYPNSGIVIIAGETGSGKTTKLGAIIRELLTQDEGKRIVSYESPIEFDFRAIPNRTGRIGQSDPHQHIKGYPRAGANALRRNPDVILLGEARDYETIQGAVNNAETGHSVYTTVHVGSVAETFTRMINVFPADERMRALSGLIGSTRVLVYQELLSTLDGGRVAAREFLVLNDKMRTKLYATPEDQITPVLKDMVRKYGQPIIDDIRSYYEQGLLPKRLLDQYEAEFGEQGEAA
ncbi:secretion system protein E [Marinobacter halodurans]|uniref:Secretion system protein E n=1 Tax=Marinobacter halodurans TaxID=2528979 RepID=A0ABY1ZQE0_9GAMM|nr:ATPase, T2SS/T4P/T4SS family [Marinobacter halodurans]TBW57457.1 secretion system protein E [Marinobacter halodurans]